MNSVNPRMIHGKLILSITLMCLFSSCIVAAYVWHMEKNKIGQDILWQAKSGFKHVNSQIRTLLNSPDNLDPDLIQKQLIITMSRQEQNQSGQFVAIGIYTLDKKLLAMVTDDTYKYSELVRDKAGKPEKTIKTNTNMEFSVIDIGGIPHMQILSPLNNDFGEMAALGETFFALAPRALEKIRTKAVKIAGAAVIIVIFTTCLIYPVVLSLVNQVSLLSARLFESNLELLKVLGSAVAKRDSDTDSHNYRVTIISVKLAESLKLTRPEIQRLIKGAFLHDVGKIGIEDNILHKPGQLTENEFMVMKKHVPYGVDIVNKAEWIKEATDIVECHHERYDGKGYGKGLKGNQIPEIARIFSIADVFDALTSRRPYKEPFSFEKTMKIILAGRGSHFDPDFVDTFENIASPLFARYSQMEDNNLKTELSALIKKYFPGRFHTILKRG